MDRWDLLFTASGALDAALLAALGVAVARARHRGLLAATAFATWAVKLALLRAAGLQPHFGLIHVLWLDGVVGVPAFGLALLAAGRRLPRPRRRLVLGVPCLLLAPVGAYAAYVEPDRIVVERTEVPVAPARAGDDPVRLIVLSDLQFRRVGDHEREAVRRAMALRPDIVLLPGDVHQDSTRRFREELPRIRALLRGLRAPGGVFFAQGDADGPQESRLLTQGTGVRWLHDEVATVRVRDRVLRIGGIQLAYWEPRARALRRRLERLPGEDDVRLLLAHRPDPVLELRRDSRIDLVVAGHTHGGQLQLPLVGPLSTATHVPRDVAAGGLHDVGGGRRIYVSRGIGVERGQAPRFRLGAPPEVSLLVLDG
ncbi:metallophosphoesterase [Conexibacter sp. SYSU D00693]|uniref:metallophosphoesterase n=1 Tax=Conexibacter sp. SYSU D00693 TaxID=2812560 RepID=UPI00196AE008|nr:metallophosphoesterase [Conexibacter sp. SYSU D00693]